MARDNMVAQAASFGAEGFMNRGFMVKEWTMKCPCGEWLCTRRSDATEADKAAKQCGWRYTSKRGWECPAHRRAK